MTTISERYVEIMAALPEGTDLELDDAPIEVYIMEAADVLGFDHPALALNLALPFKELLESVS